MGVEFIKAHYVHNGESFPVHHTEKEKSIDETQITTSAPNIEEYTSHFNAFAGHEKIFVTHHVKMQSMLGILKGQNIPGLKIIETGFLGPAVIEVLKRVMQNKPYDDIRYFFITKNPIKRARVFCEKYTLFEMKNGDLFPIRTFETKFAAVKILQKYVNTPLVHGKDLNIAMRHHLGREFVGGVRIDD